MKKNYNPLIYFLTTLALAIGSYRCNSQIIITDSNLKPAYDIIGGGFTIGNECGVDNFMMLYYDGDMTLNGDLYIQDCILTIYGELYKNGYEVHLSCPDAELIIEEETLSVNTEALDSLTLFPNPTDGIFHINTDKPFTVVIYDSKLSLVNDMPDLRHAPSGVYLVLITIEEKTFSKRVIKK